MGNKKCEICTKRRARYFISVHPLYGTKKDMEVCSICIKKYKKIEERHLVKAYQDLVKLINVTV